MSSPINKKKISLHHCFCLPTLSLYAGCWVDEWGVAAWLLHRMLPPWSFSAWHTKPTRRGKHWRETPEQEASLPPGVVLEGKLCTVYLDIYLKTNLLFWDCSLSLLLSVFPLFLSLLPLCVCVCVCVCVCARTWVCTHQDPGHLSPEVLLMSKSLPVPAGHLQLLPSPGQLLLKLCLPRPSSGMAVRWAQLFFLCGSRRDHGKYSSTPSPDELWECKPVASSICLLRVLPPEKLLCALRQRAFMFSRPT